MISSFCNVSQIKYECERGELNLRTETVLNMNESIVTPFFLPKHKIFCQ